MNMGFSELEASLAIQRCGTGKLSFFLTFPPLDVSYLYLLFDLCKILSLLAFAYVLHAFDVCVSDFVLVIDTLARCLYTYLYHMLSPSRYLKENYLIKISGEDVSIADLADFICAAQIAREFDEFHADPEEQKVWLNLLSPFYSLLIFVKISEFAV